MLWINEGDAGHECVPVQPGPGPAFEVSEPKFTLELLVRLLANPSCYDCRSKTADRTADGQVAQIIFLFAVRASFANQPDF